jgi:iron(III) transport system permease protein
MSSTIVQVDNGLEEAARIHGANWPRAFWYVWMPLLKSGFVAGWIIGFVFSFSELALVAFLYGPKSMVLSALMLSLWTAGQSERGSVVAIVTTVIILAFVLGVRRLGRSTLAEGSL